MHDLAGITAIGLDEECLLMATAALPHLIAKYPLGPVIDEIELLVARQGLRKTFIVGGYVAPAIAANGVNDVMIIGQQGLLKGR